MAKELRFKVNPPKIKAPTFKRSGSDALQNLVARDILERQEERRKPRLAAETAEETERAKRKFAVGNAYRSLSNDFIQMRDLTLQVENSLPGMFNRLAGGTKNYLSLMKQDPTGSMLARHQNIVDSSLRNIGILRANETESRFSNEDARRMQKLFGNPIWDTEIKEDLDYSENSRTLDDRARTAGIELETNLFEQMFPQTLPGMLGRKGASKILLGDLIRRRESLSDDEMREGTTRLDK